MQSQIAGLIRVEGTHILATLTRTLGDLRLAEDAVQEAVERALHDWPRSGVPRDPRAWLTVAARHRAIDLIRRERKRAGKEREAVDLMELSNDDAPSARTIRDDQLRLIFTCCHPALSMDARVALALRVLCGLTVEQIAACLLTGEAAMAKRLTRTRTKIAKAGIPYRIPADSELPARLGAVCAVLHALYTMGHTTPAGPDLGDIAVSAEAIRLARALTVLLPDEATPAAVLALMLLSEARRDARLDGSGEIVLLADQDRSQWNRAMIDDGIAHLNWSLNRTNGVADPYQLQAALAAQHAVAATYSDTDWIEILRLYDLLIEVYPNPAVALNRVVAVAEVHGAPAALDALQAVSQLVTVDDRFLAVRSELLGRAGRRADAIEVGQAAVECSRNDAQRRHRQARQDTWRTTPAQG